MRRLHLLCRRQSLLTSPACQRLSHRQRPSKTRLDLNQWVKRPCHQLPSPHRGLQFQDGLNSLTQHQSHGHSPKRCSNQRTQQYPDRLRGLADPQSYSQPLRSQLHSLWLLMLLLHHSSCLQQIPQCLQALTTPAGACQQPLLWRMMLCSTRPDPQPLRSYPYQPCSAWLPPQPTACPATAISPGQPHPCLLSAAQCLCSKMPAGIAQYRPQKPRLQFHQHFQGWAHP